jgi:hypothetical protein
MHQANPPALITYIFSSPFQGTWTIFSATVTTFDHAYLEKTINVSKRQ